METDGTMYGIVDAKQKKMMNRIAAVPGTDQPLWTTPGVNAKDYFNFGLDDEKWKLYINKQILMRFEKNLIQKHLNQKELYEKRQRGAECMMPPPPYMNYPMYPPLFPGGHP